MRRLLCLVLLAASLFVPGPAQAQSDPGNRLSLEALTAPQPGDGQGYRSRRSYTRGATRRTTTGRYGLRRSFRRGAYRGRYAPRRRSGYAGHASYRRHVYTRYR